MNARGDQQALEKERSGTASDLTLRLAIAEYDRTRPIIDGRVKAAGIRLDVDCAWIGDFCNFPVYERYDVAEMSFSWYVAARMRGEPVIALPVFPLRMAVHGYFFCRTDAPFTSPRDLVAKRIASTGYRYTVNLWLRGIMKDRYGVSPEQLRWFTNESEGAGFEVPPGIDVTIVKDKLPDQMLFDGEVDAVMGAVIPASFERGDPRIRRIFPDTRAEMRKYVAEVGFMPVTHVIVMKDMLAKEQPWVAESLVHAFREAQRVCDELHVEPKRHSHPESVFILEEQRKAYGDDVWKQGFEPNLAVIETFVRYAHEQGYIARRPKLEELFVPNTLAL
jgi:4,5-dihydroxyphthalate decarboxylase